MNRERLFGVHDIHAFAAAPPAKTPEDIAK